MLSASLNSRWSDPRRRYGFWVTGYVVMPEHVHLLLSEPERASLSRALQALKQSVARQLIGNQPHFWQARYFESPRFLTLHPRPTLSPKDGEKDGAPGHRSTLKSVGWATRPQIFKGPSAIPAVQ
jgi:hypothetical protein